MRWTVSPLTVVICRWMLERERAGCCRTQMSWMRTVPTKWSPPLTPTAATITRGLVARDRFCFHLGARGRFQVWVAGCFDLRGSGGNHSVVGYRRIARTGWQYPILLKATTVQDSREFAVLDKVTPSF